MELKKRLDPRIVFVGLYVLAFLAYIIYGLQPVGAANYEVAAALEIPSIGLNADVTELELEDRKLPTPDTIVGSYTQTENKTLLIGHSTTVFQNLKSVKLDDVVNYNGKDYRVIEIDMMPKAKVNMGKILSKADRDTIVIMTCAGTMLDGGDATHRLIITAIEN